MEHNPFNQKLEPVESKKDQIVENLQISEQEKNIQEVFKLNPELARIGTEQQYIEYLKTIFPDSKIKDIVYHGTNRDFDEFKKKVGLDELSSIKGIDDYYFTDNKKLAEGFATKYKKVLYAIFDSYESDNLDWYHNRQKPAGDFEKFNKDTIEMWDKINAEFLYIVKEVNSGNELNAVLNYEKIKYFKNKEGLGFQFGKMFLPYYLIPDYNHYKILPDGRIIYALLDIKNPHVENGTRDSMDSILSEAAYLKKFDDDTIDGGIQEDSDEKNIVVFSPSQIHILGSKADIEKFNEFASNMVR
ncbi:MAG: hypothetical protein KBD48_00195 [Candidatus Pacebacteria bacterium]|nr:hypothetical protein [Candidatus Paceibacterota bacterium]MBP9715600.1 hypothetical protein [Candidatus Paceibacterota bacterium]